MTNGSTGSDTNGLDDRRQAEDRAVKGLVQSIKSGELYEEILSLIDKKGELPVAPGTFAVLTHLSNSSETSLSELSNIVLKDYGLTSKILKLVNSVHFMRFGEITTVSRAILLLGFQNVKNAVITMSLFENLQKARAPYFPHLLSRAIYAALMGENLARRLRYPNPEEAFLGSLFCCLGEILAAYYTAERYELARRIALEGDGSDEAEELVSLMTHFYRSIGMRVGRKWGLPSKMIVCMRQVEETEANSVADDDRLHCVCSIANRIADIAEQHSDQGTRQQLIERVLDFYGRHYDTLRPHIQEISVSSADDLEKFCATYDIDLRTTPIGAGLFPEPAPPTASSTEFVEELQTDFLSSMSVDSVEGAEASNPEMIFANGMRDISRALLDNYNLDDVFTIIMETIYRGLRPAGISRALLLIRNARKPLMDVRLSLGESTAVLKRWFIVPLDEERQDLFDLALSRHKELLIKDSTAPVASKVIPQWLLTSFDGPSFLMVLPIVVTGKAIGALYIDGPADALTRVAPTHFYYLRILRDEAVLAIKKKSGL